MESSSSSLSSCANESTNGHASGYANDLRTRKPVTSTSDQQQQQVETKVISPEDSEQFSKTTRQMLKLILPSTYVRRIFPTRFYRGCCTASAIFWFVIGVLVIRKTQTATTAVRYIKTHSNSVGLDTIERSDSFAELIHTLDTEFTRPPAFFLLNQYV